MSEKRHINPSDSSMDVWTDHCQVQISADRKRLWVNSSTGSCILRVMASKGIEVTDLSVLEGA